MDPITLWDAFFERYHLPDFPLPDACTIVDLGANAGYTAASFASIYPGAKIIAVEMDAANAALCSKNLAQFGDRCRVVHAAIWSRSGTIAYDGNNVHSYSIGAASGVSLSAPALTIEQLFDDFGLDQVDYLKMDIEGAEAQVLQPQMVWPRRVRNLSVEVHPPATLDGCKALLAAHGFSATLHGRHASALIARKRVQATE